MKPFLPGHTFQSMLESIIRVDHAGEYAAVLIYKGQLFVLQGHQSIQEMLKGEMSHLSFFEDQIRNHNVRPTFFLPLWHASALGLGVVSAMLGERMAMACTRAVEEVIAKHYQDQISFLEEYGAREDGERSNLLPLRLQLEKIKAEEEEHGAHAQHHTSQRRISDRRAFLEELFERATARACRLAISLSENI